MKEKKKGQYFWSLVDRNLVEAIREESYEMRYILTNLCGCRVQGRVATGRPGRRSLWYTSISLFLSTVVARNSGSLDWK